jgi:hypothetical protein
MPAHVLLLSGGSVKGAVQVRSIERILALIRERTGDIYALPDAIVGTSVGASNGAVVALGLVDELDPLWRKMDDANPWDGIKGVVHATPFAKGGFWTLNHPNALTGQMQHFGLSPFKLRTRFGCGIWLPERDEHVVPEWDHTGPLGHRISVNDGIVASSAMMGLFDGVTLLWDGEESVAADGGHEHVLPPVPSWVQPGDYVYAVFCYPVEPGIIRRPVEKTDGRIERFLIAADKGMHAASRGDFEALKLYAKAGVHVWVTAPREDPGGMLDASHLTIVHRLDVIGHRMAEHPILVS